MKNWITRNIPSSLTCVTAIFLLLCTSLVPCYAQETASHWRPVTYQTQRSIIYDLLGPDMKGKWETGFTFFGPDFHFGENVIEKGLDVASLAAKTSPAAWAVNLGTPLWAKHDTYLFVNCYTRNIDSLFIGIVDTKNKEHWYSGAVKDEGYQVPFEIPLEAFVPVTEPGGEPQSRDSIQVKKLLVRHGKRDPGASSRLVFGELKMLKRLTQKVAAKGLYFYELTQDKMHDQVEYTYKKFGNSLPVLQFAIYRDLYAQTVFFEPGVDTQDTILQLRTLQLIKTFIEHYPYFREHHLVKPDILKEVDNIILDRRPFDQKIFRMDSLVSTFYDGHFLFQNVRKEKPVVPGPVYIREINGSFQVIAVFNESLNSQVKPGDEVLAIDGIAVPQKIKTYAGRLMGNEQARREQAIARLLHKHKQDSTILTIKRGKDINQVVYHYSAPNKVPQNFRPVHGSVKSFGKALYYRLSRWDYGDWIRFFNHKEELEKSAAIIIDLRGNTGGSESEAIKFLSCFIRVPVSFSVSAYQSERSGKLFLDSNIVRPNPYLNLSAHKLIILIDPSTACASEIFASILKKHSGAVIIGNGPSMGSYASGEEFILPFNVVMKTNILTKFIPVEAVENRGIQPDILVPFKHYTDLYPYEDKVLKTALELIGTRPL